jgi:hypothetical protein
MKTLQSVFDANEMPRNPRQQLAPKKVVGVGGLALPRMQAPPVGR